MKLEEFYRICDAIEPDEYGCHPYPKATPGFYFIVNIDGQKKRVHRLALERKLGRPIRSGYQALHTCDYQSCINPDHLYEGTPADNARDTIERNPDVKKAAGKTLSKKWKDPEYRARVLPIVLKINKIGVEASKKKYRDDPEYRAKILANLAKGPRASAEARKKRKSEQQE